MDERLVPAAHHRKLIEAFHEIDARRLRRLMVFWPPGHAKSTYASHYGPAWLTGRNPTWAIVHCSHDKPLAERFGRRIRNTLQSEEAVGVFGRPIISADARAAARWETLEGGEYYAAGVGGGISGRRSDLGLIDDPIKGRKQADSPTLRESIWQWYLGDFRPRMKPSAAIVIIQCMTGDTPVRMADGTEKPLRDVRPGDQVATYIDGRLATSTVKNWASNGLDRVYAIKTTSGKIVKANERHPFLVHQDGKAQWIKTKNLRPGQEVVRVNGESGKARPAQPKDAISQQSAAATAPRTTTRSDGPTALGHLLQTLSRGARRILSTVTASLLKNTTAFWPSKAVAVQCASNHQATTCARTGAASCASITATAAERSAHCCATTATLSSDTQRPPKSPWPQLNTCDFTLDPIAEITPLGVEEVFDVQIEGTENFIANGLVSHNTRWHEDDLSGRILPEDYKGTSGVITARDGEEWTVLNFPAVCERTDDGTGRQIGEPLWPEWYTLKMLEQEQTTQGSRNWSALYQQRPRPGEGGIFKEAWCAVRYHAIPIEASMCVHSWDTAQKENEINDPSAGTVWQMGRGASGYWLRDVICERLAYPKLRRAVINLAERDRPAAILIEDKSSGQSMIQDLRASTSLPIIAIEPVGDKIFRANEQSAAVEAGLLHLPATAPWLIDFEGEFFGYPLTTHDDQVDSTTQFLKWARTQSMRIESAGVGARVAKAAPTNDAGFGGVGRNTQIEGFNDG